MSGALKLFLSCCNSVVAYYLHQPVMMPRYSVSREALTEHVSLQVHTRDPSAIPSTLAPPYTVNEVLWYTPPGMAGLGFSQPLQPIHLQVSNDHAKPKLVDF